MAVGGEGREGRGGVGVGGSQENGPKARVTNSLGRSRDNWRKWHQGFNIFYQCIVFDCFFHIVGHLFYIILIAHSPCQ